MTATIEAHEIKVADLFGPKYRFSIPTYQRQYSWLKENAEQLFDDIAEEALSKGTALKDMRPYFVGSMVLVKKSDNVDAEVIDGQQRLTTLTILLAAIRDTSSKRAIEIEKEDFSKAVSSYIYEAGNAAGGIKASYRLHVRPADLDFFQANIQRPGGINALSADTPFPDSQKRLAINALAFMAKLEGKTNEQVVLLGQYILQKVTVALVTTSDEEAAFRIFSVLNDRGLELSPADILKAEVIGSLPSADRAKYSEKWEEAEKDLGKESFDELFAHIRMIGVKRKSKESTVKEIRESIRPRDNAAYFVDKMVVPYAEIMIELKEGEIEVVKDKDEIAKIVGWLNQISSVVYVGHSDWVPVALELTNRLRFSPTDLLASLQRLEALTFGMMALHKGATGRIDRFGAVLKEIEAGVKGYPALDLTKDEKTGIMTSFSGNLYEEYYCRYALKRLDSYYAGAGATYDAKTITIEHILPQHPAAASQWLKDFPDVLDRLKIVNSLGNLTLLTGRRNSAASNSDYANKSAVYFKKKQGHFVLTAFLLRDYKTWTKVDFEKRHADLLNACKAIWNL